MKIEVSIAELEMIIQALSIAEDQANEEADLDDDGPEAARARRFAGLRSRLDQTRAKRDQKRGGRTRT